MSEHEQGAILNEPELYVEPARMTTRDTVGVVIALIALAIIGVGGYVWLRPDLDARTLLASRMAARERPARGADPEVKAAVHTDEHVSCPYCGMWSDTSAGAVAVMWAGGGSNTLDSFDCVFNYSKENDVRLESGTVKNYPPGTQPEWIDIKTAYYLYDTEKTVAGSMPPYVAAFATRELAEGARAELGGEVVDFAALEAKWK